MDIDTMRRALKTRVTELENKRESLIEMLSAFEDSCDIDNQEFYDCEYEYETTEYELRETWAALEALESEAPRLAAEARWQYHESNDSLDLY